LIDFKHIQVKASTAPAAKWKVWTLSAGAHHYPETFRRSEIL